LNVVLLSPDLAVGSRVEGAARMAGLRFRQIGEVDQLAAAGADECALLIIDLSTPGLDVASAVSRWREAADAASKIIAFGPHVHEAKLAAARAAGCDRVLTRGQFFSQSQTLLRDVASQGEVGG
jgi:DNA-binding response OmpR family regulator